MTWFLKTAAPGTFVVYISFSFHGICPSTLLQTTRATQQNLDNQSTAGYAPLTERSKGRTAAVRTRPRRALTLRVNIPVTTLNPPDTALILTRNDAGSAANGSKRQPSSSSSSSYSYSSSGRWGPSPSRAGTGGAAAGRRGARRGCFFAF